MPLATLFGREHKQVLRLHYLLDLVEWGQPFAGDVALERRVFYHPVHLFHVSLAVTRPADDGQIHVVVFFTQQVKGFDNHIDILFGGHSPEVAKVEPVLWPLGNAAYDIFLVHIAGIIDERCVAYAPDNFQRGHALKPHLALQVHVFLDEPTVKLCPPVVEVNELPALHISHRLKSKHPDNHGYQKLVWRKLAAEGEGQESARFAVCQHDVAQYLEQVYDGKRPRFQEMDNLSLQHAAAPYYRHRLISHSFQSLHHSSGG